MFMNIHEPGVNVHEQMSIMANAEWGAVFFVFGFTLCYLDSNFTDQMTAEYGIGAPLSRLYRPGTAVKLLSK